MHVRSQGPSLPNALTDFKYFCYRYCVNGRPERDFLCQGRDYGYPRQERQVVASTERGWRSWKYVVPAFVPSLILNHFLVLSSRSCAVKLPPNYLTTITTRAGRLYRHISLMMLYFSHSLWSGSDSDTRYDTITNACAKSNKLDLYLS